MPIALLCLLCLLAAVAVAFAGLALQISWGGSLLVRVPGVCDSKEHLVKIWMKCTSFPNFRHVLTSTTDKVRSPPEPWWRPWPGWTVHCHTHSSDSWG